MFTTFMNRHFRHSHGSPESLIVDRNGRVIKELAQTSIAVLLSEAATADGAAAKSEFDVLMRALQEHTAFRGLNPNELSELLADAHAKPDARDELFAQLRWRLSESQRVFLAALAWEVLLADHVLTEGEAVFASRLGAQLGLSAASLEQARTNAERGATHWPD